MTDMLHKPIGWGETLNKMTEAEWKEYFRLRKELDVEYSEEELKALIEKAMKLYISGKTEESSNLALKIPLRPFFACSLKQTLGLREIMKANLSLAKKAFPNEF